MIIYTAPDGSRMLVREGRETVHLTAEDWAEIGVAMPQPEAANSMPRVWKKWTPEEVRILSDMAAAGEPPMRIAAALPGRTRNAINNRQKILGLIKTSKGAISRRAYFAAKKAAT